MNCGIKFLENKKIKYAIPLILIPIAIANNVEIGVKENAAVLNLEEKITLTTIINGQILLCSRSWSY